MRGRQARDTPRARTLGLRELKRDVDREREGLEVPDRPVARGECELGARPCPFVGCRHHLYLDVHPRRGSIKFNFPHLDPVELTESCALDVAEQGGVTLEAVALLMNLTRERVRQIEERARRRMRRRLAAYDPELGG